MYDTKFIKDGDPAFEIEGIFQIHNMIYVLTQDADNDLLLKLTDLGYQIHDNGESCGYTASLTHALTKEEIPKFSLTEPHIHNIIISAASQRADIGYYNRPHDQMSDIAISRMSGFVKNMVNVRFNLWEEFVSAARDYHAQDFIRALAHWASSYSDKKPRAVKLDAHGTIMIIEGAKQFNLTKPLPIKGFYPSYPIRQP